MPDLTLPVDSMALLLIEVQNDIVHDRLGGGARDVGSHGAGTSGFRAVATTPSRERGRRQVAGRLGVGMQQAAQPRRAISNPGMVTLPRDLVAP